MIRNITNLYSKIKKRNNPSKQIQVGNYSIWTSREHKTDLYMQLFKLYDVQLGFLAKIIVEKYRETSVIDIGANIGDSAAVILSQVKVPILCIEGCKDYLQYLSKNKKIIGSEYIYIEESFVLEDDHYILQQDIKKINGTATINGSVLQQTHSESSAAVKSLKRILAENIKFENFKLLKIDTDGYDCTILEKSLNELEKNIPILFFEYLVSDSEDHTSWLDTLKNLMDLGYKYFIVFDNFGHPLLEINADYSKKFYELNHYLLSNQKNGTAVYYFDICAFHQNDVDIKEKFYTHCFSLP